MSENDFVNEQNRKLLELEAAVTTNADLKEKLYLHEYTLYKARFCERKWRRASLKLRRESCEG